MDDGTSRKYMLTDSLGSVTAVYDAVAGTCAFTTYDSYGNSDTAPASPYGYAGMRYAVELDGYITPNRAYTPATGRWLQSDPLGITPNPQTGNAYAPLTQYDDGANIYTYVNNNSINGIDEWGLGGASGSWEDETKCQYEIGCSRIEDGAEPWRPVLQFLMIPHCDVRQKGTSSPGEKIYKVKKKRFLGVLLSGQEFLNHVQVVMR